MTNLNANSKMKISADYLQVIIHNGEAKWQGDITTPIELYYEVMRVKEGVILFQDEHLKRLENSLNNEEDIKREFYLDCDALLEEAGVHNANIKYSLFKAAEGWQRIVHYVKSYYPTEEMYENGVAAKSVLFNRENPNRKYMTNQLDLLRQQIVKEDIFDFICFNEEQRILEGTKTNIFFMIGNSIYTAPDSEVLGGITRKVICEALDSLTTALPNDLEIKSNSLELKLQAITIDQLSSVDAAFFTGTSIGVLPIASIDKRFLEVRKNVLLKELRALYQTTQEQYITSKKGTSSGKSGYLR